MALMDSGGTGYSTDYGLTDRDNYESATYNFVGDDDDDDDGGSSSTSMDSDTGYSSDDWGLTDSDDDSDDHSEYDDDPRTADDTRYVPDEQEPVSDDAEEEPDPAPGESTSSTTSMDSDTGYSSDDWGLTDDDNGADEDVVLDPTQTGDYYTEETEAGNPFPILAIGSGSEGFETEWAQDLAGETGYVDPDNLPVPEQVEDMLPDIGGQLTAVWVAAAGLLGLAYVLGELVGGD